MNIKDDSKIIGITRENYKNYEWDEYVLYQYRGLNFSCDHEYDAGVYDIWLRLPVGPKYIHSNQIGDLPYIHQYRAGYIEGDNSGPYFHLAVEKLMDYVDEYYEYLSPYINNKNNDSNENKSFTEILENLKKKVDDLQIENSNEKNNVNEAKYDGTPYAEEFDKIYEAATQEKQKEIDKFLSELEEKIGIDDEDNNISNENRFVYQPGDLRVSRTQCQLCKFYNINNKDMCRAYPEGKPEEVVNNKVKCEYRRNKDKFVYQPGDLLIARSICDLCIHNNLDNKDKCELYPEGKPEKVVNKQVMCKHFEHESDKSIPKNT